MTNPIFPELPTQLGIYSLTQLIGEREHSELYLATQSYVDRAVVIEVLRPEFNMGAEQVDFLDSARLNAAVTLPRVAPVLESASTGALHYVIQEEPGGKPLRQLPDKLSVDQAFALVQSVAEVYCACLEQGVAARPIQMQDIYVDDDGFRFFSPVMAGGWTDGLREAQMLQLADILDHVLTAKDATKSNISIIIHWLRNGYGGAPMQWQPLAASLSAVRATRQRGSGVPLLQRIKALCSSRLTQRLAMRALVRLALVVVAMLGVAAGVGSLGLLYREKVVEMRPALSDDSLYCEGGSGTLLRIQAQPVSVEEYNEFLQAWAGMTRQEKAALCMGLPDDAMNEPHTPQLWGEQVLAATEQREWQGFKMSPHAPVRGVSYYDAAIYARYRKADLPSMNQLRTARKYCGEPLMQEWTRDQVPAILPYELHYIVYPSAGDTPINELRGERRELGRGFRIVNKIKK